jgi:hypothetical protein
MKRVLDLKGDAVMVTAVLMLSIILSVGGRLLLDYGEMVGKDEDMLHAVDVSDSLMSTRGSMGSLLRSSDTENSILNRITLGTFGNPYLGVARSSGSLEYYPQPENFEMIVVLEDGVNERMLNTISGSLTFTSNNFYYHDQQYIFQAGGIVVEEYGYFAMSTNPTTEVIETSTGWAYEMMLYTMTGGQWTVSGIESVALNIQMAGFSDLLIEPAAGEIVSLRINCHGEQAWEGFFRSQLTLNGLVENTDFTITTPSDWDSATEFLEIDMLGLERFSARIGEMEVTI